MMKVAWGMALFGAIFPLMANGEERGDSVLPAVIVTATRQREDLTHVPQEVSVVTSEDIQRLHPQTSADMLSSTGLVAVQKSQQGGGSPVLRGFESSRILLELDGVRMNNLIYRGGHLQNIITVDPNMLERAEILYGPASVAYGSDALGGVIVFTTPQPQTSLTGTRFFGNAAFQFDGANTGAGLHLDFNIGGRKFASYTSVSFNNFGDLRAGRSRNPFMPDGDGYIHRDYTVDHFNGQDYLRLNGKPWLQKGSGYHQYDIVEKLLYRPNDRVSHLLNLQLSNSGDIDRYDRLTDMKGKAPKFAQWYYGPQTRVMAAYTLSLENCIGADNASLILAYQNVRESRCNRKLYDPWLGTRAENVSIVSLNADWTRHFGVHRLHVGVDGALQYLASTAHATDINSGEVKALDTRYPDGGNHMHNIDIFASHVWEINSKWTLSDGVRVGFSSLRSKFTGTEFFPFLAEKYGEVRQDNPTYSISAGIAFRPTREWKLGFNIATGYRVPNIDDLGKVFDSEPGMVVVPNPHIKPEKTVSADLNAALAKSDAVEWSASLFGTYLFDAIALAPASVDGSDKMMYDGELSDIFSNRNVRLAYILGASTSVQVAISRNFSANGAVTYTYGNIIGRNGAKDEPLDHIAPLFGRVGVAFDTDARSFRAEIFSLFNGRKPLGRYNLNGEDNIGYATVSGLDGKGLPAWFTLNLSLTWNPSEDITLFGGVDNLLDTEYRVFASGISAPGRNFYAGVRLSF